MAWNWDDGAVRDYTTGEIIKMYRATDALRAALPSVKGPIWTDQKGRVALCEAGWLEAADVEVRKRPSS